MTTKDKTREELPKSEQGQPKDATSTALGTVPFPFSGSINEPQTVSLPLPQGTDIPVPEISSLDPAEATIGDESFTLFVHGTNFFADSVLWFAGQPEPTTLNEDGTLSTGINMPLWQGADTVKVQIKNGPSVSEEVDFTFHETAPASRKKGK